MDDWLSGWPWTSLGCTLACKWGSLLHFLELLLGLLEWLEQWNMPLRWEVLKTFHQVWVCASFLCANKHVFLYLMNVMRVCLYVMTISYIRLGIHVLFAPVLGNMLMKISVSDHLMFQGCWGCNHLGSVLYKSFCHQGEEGIEYFWWPTHEC
jgi:hypothetical protein